MRGHEAHAPGLGLSKQEMAFLGGSGVLRQSVKAFSSVRLSVLLLLVLLALPYASITGFDLDWRLEDLIPGEYGHSLSEYFRMYFDFPEDEKFLVVGAFLFSYGITSLLDVVFFFFLSPVMGVAVFHTVGSACEGRSVSVLEVLRAVGRLVWRMFAITFIYSVLIVLCCGVYFSIYCIFMVAVHNALGALIPFALFTVLFVVSFVAIHIISSVARAVTCLEDSYGLAAFKRAKVLLHNKWGSGCLLVLILALLSVLLAAAFAFKLTNGMEWTLRVVYVVFAAVFMLFSFGSWAMFYLSCAAHAEVFETPNGGNPSKYEIVKFESSV